MRVILASASPRRKELLEQMGISEFEICPATGEEMITKTVPSDIVMELAERKAEEVYSRIFEEKAQNAENTSSVGKTDGMQMEDTKIEDTLLISADTIVVYENEILGKPRDEADARRMLGMLSGHTHQVYTGVCIMYRDSYSKEKKKEVFFEQTDVSMCEMSAEELEHYIQTGEPFDKAGGYGIQGKCAIYIDQISGDYNNVVGLPICALYHKLRNLEIAI